MQLFRGLIFLSLLLFILIASLSAILRQEDSSEYLLTVTVPYWLPELSVGASEGSLFGKELVVHDVQWHGADNLKIEFDQLKLQWKPRRLWHRELSLTKIHINSLSVTLADSEPEPEIEEISNGNIELPEIELPIDISIAVAQLNQLVVYSGDTEILSSSGAKLSAEYTRIDQQFHASIEHSQFQLTGTDVSLAGDLTTTPSGTWPITLLASSTLRAENSLNQLFTIQADGSLDKLNLKLNLSATQPNQVDPLVFEGHISPLKQPFEAAGKLHLRRLSLADISTELPDFIVDSKLNVTTQAVSATLSGNINIETPKGQYQLAGLDALYKDSQAILHSAKLTVRDLPLMRSGQVSQATISANVSFLQGIKGKLKLIAERDLIKANFEWSGEASELPLIDSEIRIAQLAKWFPGISGTVSSKTKLVSSPLATPTLSSSTTLTDVHWLGYAVGSAALVSDIEFSATGRFDNNLVASGVTANDLRLSDVSIVTQGHAHAHQITARLVTADWNAATVLSGAMSLSEDAPVPQRWAGLINQLSLNGLPQGDVALQGPAQLEVGPQLNRIEQFCILLNNGDFGRSCINGEYHSNGQVNLDLPTLSLPLSALQRFKPGLISSGTISGSAKISGNLNKLNTFLASAALHLSEGQIGQRASQDDEEDLTLLAYNGATIVASLEEGTGQASFNFNMANNATLQANATLSLLQQNIENWPQWPINASVLANKIELAWLSQLLPDIENINAELSADLKITGTLGEPLPNGTISIHGQKIAIPKIGLELDSWQLTTLPQGQHLTAKLSLVASDGGTLNASVAGKWANELKMSGTVTGNVFPLYQTPDAAIWANPALTFKYDAQGTVVGGEILVKKARIAPQVLKQRGPAFVSVSADQVIVSEQQLGDNNAASSHVSADIRIRFGDNVHVKALGLDAYLGGNLRVIEQPGRITRAIGEISLRDGKYSAFGQTLTIERGALLYQNTPIASPALDIRAVRKFPSVTVGINARGTLVQPEFDIFSTPPLSQSDQLSWLVLGRPFERKDGEGQGASMLARAALALQLKSAEFLSTTVGRRIGIEDVSIQETDDGEGAALVLGKYLSPRLYLSYGFGLFDTRNQLKLRYTLSPRWHAEAKSDGIDSGGDILFEIER